MDIVRTLNIMYTKYDCLSNDMRMKLYDMLRNISPEEARIMYNDISYLYICFTTPTCTDENIDLQQLTMLRHAYSSKFICGLVEIGTFMDKLIDSSRMSKDEKIKKWKDESEEWHHSVLSHKKLAEEHALWSNFLYNCRDVNHKTYERIRHRIRNPQKEWEKVVVQSPKELCKNSAIFYNNIQISKLSIEEKRALVHKYQMIQNILPASSRKTTNDLLQDIFIHELEKSHTAKKLCCSIS